MIARRNASCDAAFSRSNVTSTTSSTDSPTASGSMSATSLRMTPLLRSTSKRLRTDEGERPTRSPISACVMRESSWTMSRIRQSCRSRQMLIVAILTFSALVLLSNRSCPRGAAASRCSEDSAFALDWKCPPEHAIVYAELSTAVFAAGTNACAPHARRTRARGIVRGSGGIGVVLHAREQQAIIARRHADHRAELARERALVAEAAGVTDGGHAALVCQHLHRRLDAELGEQLLRRELEHAADVTLELRDRNARDVGERADAHAFAVMALQMREHRAQAIVGRVAAIELSEIARETDHTANAAARIERFLAGQAPTRRAVRKQVHFEMVVEALAGQHAFV